MKVFVVITTSPPATPQNRRATSRGAVPELMPTARRTPAARANPVSKRSRYGPWVSTPLRRIASKSPRSAGRSSSGRWGRAFLRFRDLSSPTLTEPPAAAAAQRSPHLGGGPRGPPGPARSSLVVSGEGGYTRPNGPTSSKSHPPGAHRRPDHRRRPPRGRAEHGRHAHPGRGRHPAPGAAAGGGGGGYHPYRRRQPQGHRGPGRDRRVRRPAPLGRPAGELPPGRGRGPPRAEDPLQSGSSLPSRAPTPRARQGCIPGRGRRGQRLRHAGRRELRLRRSGQGRPVPRGRLDRPHARLRPRALRDARLHRLRALLRLPQGLRPEQGHRRQPPLRRAASRRPPPPRRHRGRHAPRRRHQDPHRLRAAPLRRHRRHHPRLPHPALRRQGRGDRHRPRHPRRHRGRAVSGRCRGTGPRG